MQRQQLGPPAADRQHIDRERRLRRGVAVQLVKDDLGNGVALEVHDDADALAAAIVAQVADALDPLVLDRLGDLFDQPVLAELIRDFGQDDTAAVAPALLDDGAGAHDDTAAPGRIGAADAAGAEQQAAGREVRPGDVRHQFVDGDRRVVEIGADGVDHLAQVMRRNIGRHADGDAAGAVDQHVGEARRQDARLVLRPVVIGGEVDRILVDVGEQFVGHLRQPRLGIAHRRRGVGVHRAEIALPVDQRQAHRPVLRHPRERIVDAAVAVRVVFTHDVADDAGGLAVRLAGGEAAFVRAPQDAAMDRLQPVADVGQGAGDDDRHRIVEETCPHFGDDRDRLDVGLARRCGNGIGQGMLPVVGVMRSCHT